MKNSTAPTASDDRPLSEVAKRLIRPAGIVSTAWPSVRDTCSRLGLGFDRWQDGAGRLILAKGADGLYATDTVVISIPRQVGKTYLIGAIIFALCIAKPGTTVLWTAHRVKTSNETYSSLKALARLPKMAAHILKTPGGNDKAIVFRNGSRILFGAREHGFGRGFAKVSIVVFDEAQILTENAVDDMVPSTATVENALVIYIGTPPQKTDPSEHFTTMRREAIEAGDGASETLYIEIGAPDGADPTDVAGYHLFNPSFPRRTSLRAINRMRKNLGPESFLLEGMGIWPGDGPSVMPEWEERAVPGGVPSTRRLVLGVATAADGSRGSIAAAVRTSLGVQVGVVDRRPGTGWLVDEVKRIQREQRAVVTVRAKGAISDLVDDLVDAGVTVDELSEEAYLDACAETRRMVREGGLVHAGHPALTRAVRAARWQKVGQRGRFSAAAGTDISMLEAAVVAASNIEADYDLLGSAY